MGSIAMENSTNELNGHRKSVSFVDEKLIMDALNSSQTKPNGAAAIPSNVPVRTSLQSSSNSSSQSLNDSGIQQQTRIYNNNHRKNHQHNSNSNSNQSNNWRQRSAAPSNGNQHQQPSNGNSNSRSKYNNNNGANYHKSKSAATDGAATAINAKNPVIIYYNDPKVEPITVVKELLNGQTLAPAASPTKSAQSNSFSKSTKPGLAANHNSANNNHSNNHHHQNHSQNGSHKLNGHQNGVNKSHKSPNNGRINGRKSPDNDSIPNKNGKSHGSSADGKHSPISSMKNGTDGTNGTSAPKSEPLTIYYTAPDVSIEENLKQLNLKKLDQVFVNDQSKSTVESTADVSINGEINNNVPGLGNSLNKKIVSEPTKTTGDNANHNNHTVHVSSQDGNQIPKPTNTATTTAVADNVIISNNIEKKLQQLAPEMVTGDGATVNGTPQVETTVIPDIYDVINGGVSIQSPIVPETTANNRHPVICTLVSHPSHFYVKFSNLQFDKQLEDMCQFYNSDEHIELSLDVLKPFQYFAAARMVKHQKTPEDGASASKKEWIRVQLLHVESSDMINCLLIDEGCFGAFKLSELQPLYSQFRAIPKQAIRASLAGVKPKEIDWLPNQVLEFQSLVSERKLHTGQQQFDQAQFDREQAIEIRLFLADDYFEDDGKITKDKSVADILIEKELAAPADVPVTGSNCETTATNSEN